MEKKEIANYGKAVAEYIIDGGLVKTLTAIGGVHMDAANLNLRNLEKSKDKKRDLTIAIGHMQTAHIAFRNVWIKKSLGVVLNVEPYDKAYDCDRILVYEIARSFALLGDEKKVTQYMDILEKMSEESPTYSEIEIVAIAIGNFFNFTNILKEVYTNTFAVEENAKDTVIFYAVRAIGNVDDARKILLKLAKANS